MNDPLGGVVYFVLGRGPGPGERARPTLLRVCVAVVVSPPGPARRPAPRTLRGSTRHTATSSKCAPLAADFASEVECSGVRDGHEAFGEARRARGQWRAQQVGYGRRRKSSQHSSSSASDRVHVGAEGHARARRSRVSAVAGRRRRSVAPTGGRVRVRIVACSSDAGSNRTTSNSTASATAASGRAHGGRRCAGRQASRRRGAGRRR